MFSAVIGAEVSQSVYKMTVVYYKEGHLVDALDHYVTTTLANHSHVDETVKSFLDNIKEKRSGIDNVTEWIGHPINAFQLVERTANGWKKVEQNIKSSTVVPTKATLDFLSYWNEVIDVDGIWTGRDDVNISAQGLCRLHQTYKLDLKTLMSGTILNKTASPLTTSDVINIGIYLKAEDQIEWYEAYLELDDVTEKESVLYKLAMTYYMEDFAWKSLSIFTDLQKISSRPLENLVKIVRQKAEKAGNDRPFKKRKGPTSFLSKIYENLCRGNIQTNQAIPVLHCYNKVTRIPYYTGKEEVLSYIPRISRFHDVISDAEISQLQDFSKPDLTPSDVLGKAGQHFPGRISETSWIEPSKDVSKKLEKRIELLTRLDTVYREETVTSEYFQVVNYGFGGHYLRHYDALYSDQKYAKDNVYGDRIATWMFYLNTVAAGGATVFPKLNLRILPIKLPRSGYLNTNKCSGNHTDQKYAK
ncbi:Prolyl 4-hydroxylase subunit alpha-1 [Mizuhopecten yessoensis]|uniref:Prolyl 4-hydroxylase subunit alpha-1 n=1 Tax=Mizuhopecten yessoensis TaxID=6573 RepID=A0A210PF07_MIZYE|nr:Prolyl 4-hydroxylase subunit alpha-1 [Mizuhopecten yessoensis]